MPTPSSRKPPAPAGVLSLSFSVRQLSIAGLVLAFVAVLFGILLFTGTLASVTSIHLTVRPLSEGCTGTLALQAQLFDSSGGRLANAPISFFAGDSRLDSVLTDSNGRALALVDSTLAWCGTPTNFTATFAGDAFHHASTGNAVSASRAPTSLDLAGPDSIPVSIPFTFTATLRNALTGEPLSDQTILLRGETEAEGITSANGTASFAANFSRLGIRAESASFGGSAFLEPSASAALEISVQQRTCSDGTNVNACSTASVGSFCSANQSLSFNCGKCGCASGLSCVNNACETPEQRISGLISQLQPSTVLVQNSLGLGSGIVLFSSSSETRVLTNRHVVDPDLDGSGAPQLQVKLSDGRIITPTRVAVAPNGMDLAVVFLSGAYGSPAFISPAYSPTQGSEVLAVGAPFGLQNSVSRGIISSTRSDTTTTGYSYNLIQTDAAVNPGNSGGGLFLSANGALVGVNSFGVRKDLGSGINFAIDIRELTRLPDPAAWTTLTVAPRCSDGTPYGKCSSSSPSQACSNGNLVDSCGQCGCVQKTGQDAYCVSNSCQYCPTGQKLFQNSQTGELKCM